MTAKVPKGNSSNNVILACSVTLVAAVAFGIIYPNIFGYPYPAGPTLSGLSLEGIFFAIVFASAAFGVMAFVWSKQLDVSALMQSNGEGQVLASLGSVVLVFVLAVISERSGSMLATAVFAGAFGGIVHEIGQSGGKFFFPQVSTGDNSLYLGGLFGLIEGGVAGLLLVNGLSASTSLTTIIVESFLAGVAIKGFSEAVSGQKQMSGST